MKILYYDVLRKANATNSNHVKEVAGNITKHGNLVMLKALNVQKDERQAPVHSLNIFGKIGARWPLLGILLSLIGEIRIFFRGVIALKKINDKPDIVYYRHGLFNAGLWTAKLLRVPAFKEVNGIVANEKQVSNQAAGVTLDIINNIEKRMPQADKIIVVTSKLRVVN